MIVLPNKERFILDNFIEYSFRDHSDGHLPDFDLFMRLNTTDQYYLAQHYNWDDGVEVLNWIIEDPKCDKGTASLIFWNSEPDYYWKHSEETISEYHRPTFSLLKRIVEKFNGNEFNKAHLKFDPGTKVNDADFRNINSEWLIPEELKESTKGLTPISLGMIRNVIWQWRRNNRLAKRKKRKQRR